MRRFVEKSGHWRRAEICPRDHCKNSDQHPSSRMNPRSDKKWNNDARAEQQDDDHEEKNQLQVFARRVRAGQRFRHATPRVIECGNTRGSRTESIGCAVQRKLFADTALNETVSACTEGDWPKRWQVAKDRRCTKTSVNTMLYAPCTTERL